MPGQQSLYLRQDMAEPESSDRLGGRVVVYSSRCPGKTTDNEDAAAVVEVSPTGGVLVVADGMGGGAAGEQASRIAVESVREEVEKGGEDVPFRTRILNGIEAANTRILELGIGAATTLAVVEVLDGIIRPYHVGDSVILVVGQRGKVKLKTVAHSPVGHAVEAGVLDGEEAMHHEDRHLVSNILGTSDMRIEIGPPLRLARFDTVLIASDGLCDNLAVDEIVARVRSGPLPDGVAHLAVEARAHMEADGGLAPCKPDDLTIVAYRLAGLV